MKFYSFWRSLASFRVRIALNLKNVPHDVVFVDIDKSEHRGNDYADINPQMALPALVLDDGTVLTQSLAILEYLEETFSVPKLLPEDTVGRARVRALAAMVAGDMHPLIVPRVQQYLTEELKLAPEQKTAWLRHWAGESLRALEARLARERETGRFAHGDSPTFADICMVGLVTFATAQGIDLAPYPTTLRIFKTAMALPAFAAAHPLAQPDTPAAMRKT
ncbi:maleylacetoacetate isomerase [Bradyrhizobium sp. HKCCYLS1011]|uniref:maleylacetoacetate isomerase n=1 Tax=Bradyrhizobium sp. HKCCYLS1011 TaxID=3420733 RepID=UPI003EBAD7C0